MRATIKCPNLSELHPQFGKKLLGNSAEYFCNSKRIKVHCAAHVLQCNTSGCASSDRTRFLKVVISGCTLIPGTRQSP